MAKKPKRRRLPVRVRCPGCYSILTFDDHKNWADDVIEQHTVTVCERPNQQIRDRLHAEQDRRNRKLAHRS